MGSFGQALGTNLGFRAGDAISGAVLGKNKHEKAAIAAMEAETASKNAEVSAKQAEIELQRSAQQAEIELQRKKQLYAFDAVVSEKIDAIVKYRFSNEKEELSDQLSELAVQIKANKYYASSNAEAKIKNKYHEALFEKYKQGVRTLRAKDANYPQLEYFEQILKKTSRSKSIKKYWVLIAVATILLIVFITTMSVLLFD